MKQGTLQPSDHETLQCAIANLDLLWATAGISYMPKIHSMLTHAFDWQRLGRLSELLEHKLNHLHQISKSISYRTSWIKARKSRPLSIQTLNINLIIMKSKQPLQKHALIQSLPILSVLHGFFRSCQSWYWAVTSISPPLFFK